MTPSTQRGLLRAIPVASLAVPLVIFGLIYALAIMPASEGASVAREYAENTRATLVRTQAELGKVPAMPAVPLPVMDVRTPEDMANAITSIAASPTVGGLAHLSVGINGDTVSANFDARAQQLDDFFAGLGALTGVFDVRSVDVIRAASAPLVHVGVTLGVPGLVRTAATKRNPAVVPLVSITEPDGKPNGTH